MSYAGRLADKLIAQSLRKEGYSYNQILLHVKVSKDTLSRWCRDIELSSDQKKRLISNKKIGQKKGSLIAAENKRRIRNALIFDINANARLTLGEVSTRDRFIAGIALYFGEGDKADGRGAITNSDPRIISFMMEWFKEFAQIPQDRFRGALWIHEGNDIVAAEQFWSNLSGIPLYKFHKTYIAKNMINSGKIRKNVHPYGVFSIRFSCTNIQRQIMGWISALFGDRILDTSCL